MRIHHDPIAVQFRDAPAQFVWRGRLLRVLTVHTLTRQAEPWWQRPEESGVREREVWRVEAESGAAWRGIYDLARTVGSDEWWLQAVVD